MIIDIEDPITYAEGHMNGAINIPFNKIVYNPSKYLDKNKQYYLVCRKGIKSKKAVSMLTLHRYNVKRIENKM